MDNGGTIQIRRSYYWIWTIQIRRSYYWIKDIEADEVAKKPAVVGAEADKAARIT